MIIVVTFYLLTGYFKTRKFGLEFSLYRKIFSNLSVRMGQIFCSACWEFNDFLHIDVENASFYIDA